MTRKHFEAIASVINGAGDANRGNADVLLQVAQGLAEVFAAENPRFDRARFIAACFAYQKGPMQFTLTIDCGNAAFEDDLRGEVARVLRAAAASALLGYDAGTLADSNGNTVGSFAFLSEAIDG